MPELPEVETTLNGVKPHILQQTITNVVIRQYQLRFRIPNHLKQKLIHNTILSLERRAKYLLMHTEHGSILIHLGMSGHLRILNQTAPVKKHDHVDLYFANGKVLRFHDPRRFGALLWLEGDIWQHSLLKNLGVEPLSNKFNDKYLFSIIQKRKAAVKSLLMDNKIVVGIGNIYAAEALFLAGIHPLTSGDELTINQLKILVQSIKFILRYAIKQGGTSLKDFIDSDGKPGYFANKLNVYGRAGLPCVQCKNDLTLIKINQRSTVFCSFCQT